MSTPIETFVETLTESLDAAFPVNYPIFEGDEISIDGMSDDFDDSSIEEVKSSSGEKRNNKNDARLAERTSEILTNYRSFLQDHDMETCSRSSRGSLDPPADGFRQLHYYEHRIKNNLSSGSNHGGGYSDRDTCLLRDFSMPIVPLGTSDLPEEVRKYKIRPIESKRVRLGVLMSVGLLVVIVVVIGATSRGSSQNKLPMKNTPGWHEAAAYILDHEDGHEADKLYHYDAFVPKKEELREPMSIGDIPSAQILEPTTVENKVSLSEVDAEIGETEPEIVAGSTKTEPVAEDDESEETEAEVKEALEEALVEAAFIESEFIKMEETENKIKSASTEEAETSNTASEVAFDLGKILHEKFKPMWLGSREGWNGGSHDDAMQFCKSIRGKDLCPYSAMCPYGPDHTVMAGRKPVDFTGQGEQWAPVYGKANRWIMVGTKDEDASSTCKSHEQLEGKQPSWGLVSERADVKLHIMCCTMLNKEE